MIFLVVILSNIYERMLLIDENVESDVYVRCLVVYLCYYLNSVVVKSM